MLPETNKNMNIYELPELKTKRSSKFVSKVVSLTFGIIIILVLLALLISLIVRIDVTIDASGQLEPANLYYVHSPLNGEIKKVFFKSGDTFKKGDALVEFDSVKLSDQIDKLVSDLSKKKIEFETKKRTIPYDINQNEIDKKKAEAQLLKAKANLRQKIGDYFPGVNPDSFLVTYKKGSHITMDYALADIISAEAELENNKSKQEITDLKNLELQSLSIDIQQQAKAISRQKDDLQKTILKASIDGMVLTDDLQKLEGTIVSEGASILEISQSNAWKAILNVSEKDVYELSVGDSVKIEIKAMKQSNEFFLFPGKIVSISAEQSKDRINQASNGSYNVEVAINVKDAEKYLNKFRRGFSIDAKIVKDSDKILNILVKNFKKLI